VLNTTDDGGVVTIYDYDAAFRGAAFVRNAIVNSPNTDNIQTAEVALTKRSSSRWMGAELVLRHQEQPLGRAEHRQPQSGLLSQGPDVGLGRQREWQLLAARRCATVGVRADEAGAKGARTNIFRAADPDGGTPLRQLATVTLRLEPLGSERTPVMTSSQPASRQGVQDWRLAARMDSTWMSSIC
jgi:hypothetical protein